MSSAISAGRFGSAFRSGVNAISRKAEFGDFVFFFYITVLVRQYLWIVADNTAAWSLTVIISALVWRFYLEWKESSEKAARLPPSFWLIVALPLFIVYAARLSFVDLSFDVLNHRLVQAERGLRGFPFIPGDFFPTSYPLNPSPDMLGGLGRHLLGYRLGTIVGYLALIWTGAILEKSLRPYVERARLRCLAILLALFAEYVLFEINTYVGDLLSLPLLFEATRRTLHFEEIENKSRNSAYIAFFLGISVAYKLTNLAFAIPTGLLFANRVWTHARGFNSSKLMRTLSLVAVAFVIPMLPHVTYMYAQTGNPVFPLYNRIFSSPYWSDQNVFDGRWGPRGAWEILTWPLTATFKVRRLSEIPFYSGRMILAFALAFLCLLFVRSDHRLRRFCFVVLCGALLWSATTGYVRYALYLEIAGGLLVLYLPHHLSKRLLRAPRFLKSTLVSLAWFALVAQTILAANYARRYEWSMRPTVLRAPEAYASELQFLLRDHSLRDFVPSQRNRLFDDVAAWIVSDIKTSGIEIMLRPNVPMMSINVHELFHTAQSRGELAAAIGGIEGKIFSLCYEENLSSSVELIRSRGLFVGEIVPVIIPFYSQYTQLRMSLIEVLPPRAGEGSDRRISVTQRDAPLPDAAFQARLSLTYPLSSLHAGQRETISVRLRNMSDTLWPARGRASDGFYFLAIGNSWLEAESRTIINNMDGRSNLLHDVQPGDEVELLLTITAPARPGEYVLELDAIQEGVTWFQAKGSETLQLRVRVEP